MIDKYIIHCVFAVVAFTACKPTDPATATFDAPTEAAVINRMKNMKLEATILDQGILKQIPSASGLEYVSGSYYVLGDDSPFLFQLNEDYVLVHKHSLFEGGISANSRIPKSEKPDLEGLALFSYGRDKMLLLLGSGANEFRNKGFLVNLTRDAKVQELDLTRFYTFLKRILKIEKEGVLNLEGIAMDNIYTYLLHRPLGGGSNVLLRFDSDDFKDFLLREGKLPAAAVYYFSMPAVGEFNAGFSGAYTLGDKLFVTASVEATSNAIDDGEVLGSFIGIIDLRALPYASNASNPLSVPAVQLKDSNGKAYLGKAESLVVKEVDKDKTYKVIVVTDDDQGGSELLEVELKVD